MRHTARLNSNCDPSDTPHAHPTAANQSDATMATHVHTTYTYHHTTYAAIRHVILMRCMSLAGPRRWHRLVFSPRHLDFCHAAPQQAITTARRSIATCDAASLGFDGRVHACPSGDRKTRKCQSCLDKDGVGYLEGVEAHALLQSAILRHQFCLASTAQIFSSLAKHCSYAKLFWTHMRPWNMGQ